MAEFSWDDMVSDVATANEPIPPDTYTFFIKEAEYKLSKTAGDPQIVLKATVVGGPHNDKMVWHYMTATASHAYPRQLFVEGVQAVLGNDARIDFSQSPEQIAAPFVGKTFIGHVKMGEFNGEPKPEISNMQSSAPVAPVLSAEALPAPATADVPPPAPLG